MIFPKLENALGAITDKVYRNFAPEEEEPPYVVWQDEGQERSLYGGGKLFCQVIEGTIDLFTKNEDDPLFDQIQQGLNAAGIAFKLNSNRLKRIPGYIITSGYGI